MIRRLETRVAWRFGLATITLGVVSVAAVVALLGSISTARRLDHAHHILLGLERVFSSIKDAETGQRGYLLTGRDEYKSTYDRAVVALEVRLGVLEQQVMKSAPKRFSLSPLKGIIRDKMAELADTIEVRRTQGLEGALEAVNTDRGRRAMVATRQEVARLQTELETYVQAEGARALLGTQVALGTLTAGIVSSLLLFLVAHRLVAREMERRRHSEAALETARKIAEAASRSKGEFLANMSHEIRTPMNGILGMTELALGTRLSDQQREYLALVKSSADALLDIIDDILDFSKVEAGKLQLSALPFDLHETLSDTLRALAIRAHQKGLELSCRVAPHVPTMVIGDSGRLRQVVTNLVGNAIKFTERGEVVVTVEPVVRGEDEVTLRISVADTGIGVPAEKRQTIFAAFEQADGSTTRRFGGSGLGLAISTRLVSMMGGEIGVEENPGGGSVFRFTVRLALDAQAQGALPVRDPSRLAGLRILIVDDNRTNRLILEELLALWGTAPTAVDSGRAALTALGGAVERRQPFDVILLDRMMPEMDGLELAERVRLDTRFDGIRMLMLTSAGALGEAAHYAALGIAACQTKPVRQSELFEMLVGLLEPHDEEPRPAGAPETAAAAIDSSPAAAAGRAARVLLAEDHPVNQKVAARILERLGHEVTVVANGRAAVDALADQEFDLVLMDLQMPVMDGFEAVAEIRQRERHDGRHTAVVALTAHALASDRQRCLAQGFDGYLSKPVQGPALAELIDGLNKAPAEAAKAPNGSLASIKG